MLPAQKDSKFKNTVWACRIFFYFHSMIFQAVYLLLCLFIPATMQTSQILPQKVVILGAGIHGTSIAYHLSQKGIQSLIVEKSGIASAASGKAGGFLARNWGHGVTKQLHEKSFDMHIDIANTLGIESFRKINTLQVDGSRKGTNIASWLDRKVSSTMMDSETAQVTPKELTQKLMQSALDSGSRLIMGTAEKVHIDENTKTVTGIDISGFGTIQTDHVVVCLGPWSGVYCEDWFNLHIPLDGVKSTSIVFNEVEALKDEPYACFCSEDANGCHLEMYTHLPINCYLSSWIF